MEVWDAATRTSIATFDPAEERVWAVTACALAERMAIIAATEKGDLYAWDLGAGPDELLYEPVAAAQGPLEAMAVMTVGGRPRVVTAGQDSLRLWDAAEGFKAGHVLTRGHDITAMESAVVDGRRALVTSGREGVLRIWDESDLAAR